VCPIVLTPIVAPPDTGTPTEGYSLGRYRRRVARETGNFLASLVQAGSTSFLQDDNYPVKSSLDQGDLFSGKWLLRPTAPAEDRVRIVAELGYDPQTGTLRPDSGWTTAPATDEPYELHGVIEPWEQMIDLVNEGLKRCMVVDHLVLAFPTDGSTALNLTPYAPWLLDYRWVRGAAVVDPAAVEDPGDIDMTQPTFRGWVEPQGRSMYLRWQNVWTGNNVENVLVLRCLKRAYDHCRDDATGVFGERAGVIEEVHEGPVPDDWVAMGALVEFWDTFGDVVAAGNRQEAESNQSKVAAQFTTLSQQYFTLPPMTLLTPIRGGWYVGAY